MPPKRLSKAVRVKSGRPGHASFRSSLIKLNKTCTQLEKEKATRASLLSGKSLFSTFINNNSDLTNVGISYNMRAELVDSGTAEDDDYDAFGTLPPGEEGEDCSHVGRDFLVDEIIMQMGHQ